MDLSISDTMAYLLVGVLSSLTTLGVAILNKKYSKKVKPSHTAQAGYSEWVAYLENELMEVKKENHKLNERVGRFEKRLYDKEIKISRMRDKLLEFSRKYNEDVSGII